MKKYIFCLLLTLFSVGRFAMSEEWHVIKSTHFIVHYKKAPEDFIAQVIEKSESYYNEIADSLGFRRFDFWLWDNRANIYIYDDADSYKSGTGKPNWSRAAVLPKDKIIYTYYGEKEFFDVILPHEMGHIIFREFVGFDNQAIPVWLDEGVASYQENAKYSVANTLARKALNSGVFINLEDLSSFVPQLVSDRELVNIFYAESISIVDYLIKEFGKDKFVLFCQNLRDKKNLEKSIASCYPFKDIRELDLAWQTYLKK